MKNLGKIISLFLFFQIVAYATVTQYVDHTKITLGDSVTLRINVEGEEITPPDIDTLCDSEITATSSQQSIRIINGAISKSYNFYYTFEPQKSCTIESIPIAVDGKIEKTKPIKITVSSQPTNGNNSDFLLELKADKTEVFVGESFNVDLIFKQKITAQAIDSKFYPPKLDGFWIKYQSQPQKTKEGDYEVTTIHYKMAAQRAGELQITPAKIKIAMRELQRDYWDVLSPTIKWRTYFSNPITMKVLAPPKGISLVGDFTIDFQVDKTTVHPNEAVNGVITIKGEGNLEDIAKFSPFIPNANVFAKEPVIDQQKDLFTQEIAFVSDSNFTIPAMKLRFFNPKTKQIQNLETPAITITVVGGNKTQQPVVIKADETDTPTMPLTSQGNSIDTSFAITWMILSFIAGIFVGGVIVYMKFGYQKQPKTKRFSYKDQKALFIKLLPYKEHQDVKKVLDILEENMYGKGNLELDAKEIKALIEKYNIT